MREAGILLLAALSARGQSLQQAIAAYDDLYRACITEHQHKDPETVAGVLENLTAHFKEYPDAFLKAGDFYGMTGDYDLAINLFQKGIQADPERMLTYRRRIAEMALRSGNSEQAYAVVKDILQTDPQDPDARAMEGSFLLDRGKTEEALEELESVVQIRPENFMVHFNLGRAWFNKGDVERAKDQYEQTLHLRPDYQPARMALAQVGLRQNHPDRTLRYAREILQTDPNNSTAALLEAAGLVRQGQYDAARTQLQKLLQKTPDNADVLLELGVVNLSQHRYKDAEGPFRRAYQVNPSNLRGLTGLAEIHFQQQEPDEAVSLMTAELRKQPGRRDLRMELANTLTRARQHDKAIAEYRSLLNGAKPDEQADIYSRLADNYQRSGDRAHALENLEKARQLAPQDPSYAARLGEYYEQAGRKPDAMSAYRESLRLKPDNPVAMNNLAYLIAETGDNLDEAMDLAAHARQAMPQSDEVFDTVGTIYLKKHLTDSALEVFRELCLRQPYSSAFHYHYAMALSQKGNSAEAIAELRQALDLGHDTQERTEIRALIIKLSQQ